MELVEREDFLGWQLQTSRVWGCPSPLQSPEVLPSALAEVKDLGEAEMTLVWGVSHSTATWSSGWAERWFWVWFKFLQGEYLKTVQCSLNLNFQEFMLDAATLWDSLVSHSVLCKISWKDCYWSSGQGKSVITWKLCFSETNRNFWSDWSSVEFRKWKRVKVLFLNIKVC